jgi:hypothetical protein
LLWKEASDEIKRLDKKELELIAVGHILVQNPVSSAFAIGSARDPNLNWPRFRTRPRKLDKASLERRGITVRSHRNGSSEQELIEAVSARLEKPGARMNPSPAKARRDANSCAMVARWRAEDGKEPPVAWFVAMDTATGRAYAKERPEDRYPLTVTPESWLMFISAMAPPGTSALADRVAAIGSAIRRGSFLNVASSYSVEDALKMMRLLTAKDDGTVSLEELREGVQMDFNRLLKESETIRADPGHLALEIAQRSLKRSDHRAQRATKAAKEESQRLERDQTEMAEERERLKQERDGAIAEKELIQHDAELSVVRSTRSSHRTALLTGFVALALVVGFALGWDVYTNPVWIPAVLTLAALVILWEWSSRYVENPDIPPSEFLRKGVVGAAVYVFGLAASQMMNLITGQ